MPAYITNEKRADIIFHKKNGKESKIVAEFMCVCVRSVERVWKDFQTEGKVEANVHNCGRKSVITSEQNAKILEEIKNTPDITLNELIEKYDLKITEGGLSKYLKALGLTYKKKVLIQRNKTEPMYKKNASNGKQS